ncbi:MAG: methyltransferase domain-containing protein [bacterium]
MDLNVKYTKLNLGCGKDAASKLPLPFLNVDAAGDAADMQMDIRELPQSWTNRFEEARASHVLEHFFMNEMPKVIAEWVRALKPNGLLRIIVPDLAVVLYELVNKRDSKGRPSISIEATTRALAQIYGIGYDTAETNNYLRHRFIFDEDALVNLLRKNLDLHQICKYQKEDDPAKFYGINDDSQNHFSLCVSARKRGGTY